MATARLCLADPLHFGLGRRLGEWSPGRPGRTALHRVSDRVLRATRGKHGKLIAGGLVFVRPISRHLTIAGATGICGRTVAALDIAGTLLYLVAIRACGQALW